MCSMPNTAKNIWPNSNSWFYTPHEAGGWRAFLPLCIQSSSWVKQTAKSLRGVPSSPELCYQSSDTLAGSHNGMPLLHMCAAVLVRSLSVSFILTRQLRPISTISSLCPNASVDENSLLQIGYGMLNITSVFFYPQICQHHFVTLRMIFKKQNMQFELCIICNYS